MKEDIFAIPLDDTEGYLNIAIWEQEDNRSTFYDRMLDTQGIVPGRAFEEAEKAFLARFKVEQ